MNPDHQSNKLNEQSDVDAEATEPSAEEVEQQATIKPQEIPNNLPFAPPMINEGDNLRGDIKQDE